MEAARWAEGWLFAEVDARGTPGRENAPSPQAVLKMVLVLCLLPPGACGTVDVSAARRARGPKRSRASARVQL